jgi:biopolymer transport protein ExbB
MEMSLKELMEISIVIKPLLVMSVLCFAAAFERTIYYLRHARINGRVMDRVRLNLKNGNLTDAKKEAVKSSGFLKDAIVSQLESVSLPRLEREGLILFHHQRFQALLGKRLWVFGTLSFICPLIGLFGTVLGVIRSFGDLAKSGSGGPSIVAAGISEALYATAMGIGVAIVAAVIYNWFNIWMKGVLSDTDIFSQEMIFLSSNKTFK